MKNELSDIRETLDRFQVERHYEPNDLIKILSVIDAIISYLEKTKHPTPLEYIAEQTKWDTTLSELQRTKERESKAYQMAIKAERERDELRRQLELLTFSRRVLASHDDPRAEAKP